jgi:hypothetical protein
VKPPTEAGVSTAEGKNGVEPPKPTPKKAGSSTPKGRKGAKPPALIESTPLFKVRAKPQKGAKSLIRGAAKAGRIAPEAVAAAESLAAGIERLEARYERFYQQMGEAGEGSAAIRELDDLAKCEKTLAELKLKLFQFIGLEAGEGDGQVKLVVEGFEEPPSP